jgi:hypothetical protein
LSDPAIEALRRWSTILLWISIILPALGAVAVAGRFYVERQEKRLSAAKAEAALQIAREEAIAARESASSAQDETRRMATELDRSKVVVEALRAKSVPRRLSPAQEAQFLSVVGSNLRGRAVAVACKMVDGESLDMANDLIGALKKAGCNVPPLVKTSLNDLPGYVVIIPRGGVHPATVGLLKKALEAARVPVHSEAIAEGSVGVWYLNTIHIIVGSKARD